MRTTIAILLFSAVALSGCGRGTDTAGAADRNSDVSGFELVIQNSNTVAWMTMSNQFAHPPKHQGEELGLDEEPSGPSIRNGMIVQTGTYSEATAVYTGIQITKANGDTLTFKLPVTVKAGDSTITWLDLSTKYNYAGKDLSDGIPDPKFFFSLYPEDLRPDACKSLVCTGLPDKTAKGCMRNRSLHKNLNVDPAGAGLTYWQGPGGFTIQVTSVDKATPSPGAPMRVVLKALDEAPVTARLYKRVVSTEGVVTLELKEEIPYVKRVTILARVPPNHGQKHDPPWPPEDGG